MYSLINFHKTTTVVDSSVPVVGADTTQWRFVYRLDLMDQLMPGDVIEVHAEHEFSNPGLPNTEIVTAIALANGGQWYDTDIYNLAEHSVPTAGGWVAPPAGGNVDSVEHHRMVSRFGVCLIPNDLSYNTHSSVIFKVRARRDNPSGSIIIEPSGYGSMVLKHWRPH